MMEEVGVLNTKESTGLASYKVQKAGAGRSELADPAGRVNEPIRDGTV